MFICRPNVSDHTTRMMVDWRVPHRNSERNIGKNPKWNLGSNLGRILSGIHRRIPGRNYWGNPEKHFSMNTSRNPGTYN